MTDQPQPGTGAITIVGRPSPNRRPINPKAMAILGVVYVGVLAWALSGSRPDYFVLVYSLYFLVPVIQRLRPPTVVSAQGISRPWRRISVVSWDDVASVAGVAPGVYPVRLNLTGGKSLPLDDIPAADSVAVAALGGRSVQPVKRSVAAPRYPERERSAMQIEADVTRQAGALAEQRRQMAAEFRRLRGDQ